MGNFSNKECSLVEISYSETAETMGYNNYGIITTY